MKWYALCEDGQLRKLGEHYDFCAADACAEKLDHDVVWIYDEDGLLALHNSLHNDCGVENRDNGDKGYCPMCGAPCNKGKCSQFKCGWKKE